MPSSDNQSAATPAADFTQTWRYKLGLAMIIGGNLGILVGVLLGFIGVGVGTGVGVGVGTGVGRILSTR